MKHAEKNRPLNAVLLGLAILTGLAMLANGVVMLWEPRWWYATVPGVGRTGLFNQHFIRDIGILYVAIGLAFISGAQRENIRCGVWAAATLWLTAHAIFHFWEVAAGICAPIYLATDFPAVTMPALIGIGLTAWSWKNPAASPHLKEST
ncbi:MAG: hypothetical protein V4724_00705 [Pseudomonadota bacterium]